MKRVPSRAARQGEKAPTGISGFDEIAGGGLIRLSPLPIRRLTGTPRESSTVLRALGLAEVA